MLRAGSGLLQAKFSTETPLRTTLRRLIIIGAALALADAATGAPSPPPRPPEFSPPPTANTAPQAPPVAPAAPKSSSAPPTFPEPGGRTPVDVDVNTLQPFNLPPASRQRMRQCGEEWRALKMAGKSKGLIWRLFAEKCLAR